MHEHIYVYISKVNKKKQTNIFNFKKASKASKNKHKNIFNFKKADIYTYIYIHIHACTHEPDQDKYLYLHACIHT
jgi:hypothetical protein